MIKATAYSDDHCIEAEFDATPWFQHASLQEILDLAGCEWGGDYPADAVAHFMASHDPEVARIFTYLEMRASLETIGFECHVCSDTAQPWLREHRPEVAARIKD